MKKFCLIALLALAGCDSGYKKLGERIYEKNGKVYVLSYDYATNQPYMKEVQQ